MRDEDPNLCSDCAALGSAHVESALIAERVASLPTPVMQLNDLRSLPKPEPLIDGVLNKHTVTTLVGPRNIGKSFISLSWALSLVTGQRWLGHEVQRTNVLFVVKEGLYGLDNRVRAWNLTWGQRVAPEALDGFYIWKPPGSLWNPQTRTPRVSDVEAIARHHDCGLVILDTASSLFTGLEENSNSEAATVLERLDSLRDAIGGTVLLVHHTGKAAENGSRGASAWEANVDDVVMVKQQEGQRSSFSLESGKVKDGAPWKERVQLRVVTLEDGATSCVIEYQGRQELEEEFNDYFIARIDEFFIAIRNEGATKGSVIRAVVVRGDAGPAYRTWHQFVEKGWVVTDDDPSKREAMWRLSDKRLAIIGEVGE